jgi:hypothetical protein
LNPRSQFGRPPTSASRVTTCNNNSAPANVSRPRPLRPTPLRVIPEGAGPVNPGTVLLIFSSGVPPVVWAASSKASESGIGPQSLTGGMKCCDGCGGRDRSQRGDHAGIGSQTRTRVGSGCGDRAGRRRPARPAHGRRPRPRCCGPGAVPRPRAPATSSRSGATPVDGRSPCPFWRATADRRGLLAARASLRPAKAGWRRVANGVLGAAGFSAGRPVEKVVTARHNHRPAPPSPSQFGRPTTYLTRGST